MFEILVLIFLILLNGLFAMTEIAVISAKPARLQPAADNGNKGAIAVLALQGNPDQFLSAVQIGITLVGVLAGAYGGTTLGGALGDWIGLVPILTPYSQAIGLGIVVLITTYLSLVIGELVPKRLAIRAAEPIAMLMAPPLLLLARAASLPVAILTISTRFVLRLMGIKGNDQANITESEIRALLEQGAAQGIIDAAEQEMLESVFELDDTRLTVVMTHRRNIQWLDVKDTPKQVFATIVENKFSFYPLCDGDLDHIVGLIRAKDVLSAMLDPNPLDLHAHALPPLYLPDSMTVSRALLQLRQHNRQTALVIDEFGSLSGLVSLTDMIEEIIGHINLTEPQAAQRDDGSWLMDGTLQIEDLNDYFPKFTIPADEQGDYVTLAGFVLYRLGRIPAATDSFVWQDLNFEVVDMDNRRVDKVLVSQLPHLTASQLLGTS